MKYISSLVGILAMAAFSLPVWPLTNSNDIANAYVQAITGGSGSKIAGTVNYEELGCTPVTVFTKCENIVLDGKDGKALLMEAITASNVAALVPIEDLRRVYNLYDPTFNNVRTMFDRLSTKGSGYFPELDGDGNKKAILQAHIESTGPGGMYGNFIWPFDAAGPDKAKVTSVGVDFVIKRLPKTEELDVIQGPLYFWALQTDFSNMAYPEGFSYPSWPDRPPETCKDTKIAWGHVGLQYSKNDFNFPNDTQRRVNWGGGGDGSGLGDYGCGGSDVSDLNWQTNTWYEYRVERADQLGPELWNWVGSVYKKGASTPVYKYTIYGGEYVTWATTWLEAISIGCTDPKLITQWANPWMGNTAGKFRVGRVSLSHGSDGCMRSRQIVVDRCRAKWTQEQGALSPVGHADASLLRATNSEELAETDCARVLDPTEKAIVRAYVEAISGGAGAKSVSSAVDYLALGCSPNTVWNETACQKLVFNGKDGKTVLMDAISAETIAGDWQSSNIKALIPKVAMTRIMKDPRYAQAKELFGYLSTPNNGWYPYLEGSGKAKEILRQYMNSIITIVP